MSSSTIWFKHSLAFENDTSTRMLRSGDYDKKNKNVGYKYEYYYIILICSLWHSYFILPTKNKEVDLVKLGELLETNTEEVSSFLEALKYCNLLKDNKLISAHLWLGMQKYSKKELQEKKNDSKKPSTTSKSTTSEEDYYDSLSPEDKKKYDDKITAELEAML